MSGWRFRGVRRARGIGRKVRGKGRGGGRRRGEEGEMIELGRTVAKVRMMKAWGLVEEILDVF